MSTSLYSILILIGFRISSFFFTSKMTHELFIKNTRYTSNKSIKYESDILIRMFYNKFAFNESSTSKILQNYIILFYSIYCICYIYSKNAKIIC